MVKVINYLKGYVRIRVWGVSVERFMNLCGNKNILIWGVKREGDVYEMYISLPAFYELRPIVRKTSTRVVILERYGLPFLLPGFKKRMAFTVCCLAVICFWYGSSFFLWDIDFEGNFRLTDEVMMDFFEENDVRIGMLTGNLDIEQLEKEIRRTFTEVTWTSLKLDGSRLHVSMKENDAPIIESTDLEQSESLGQDLITSYDGTIVSMIVRSGVPKAAIGNQVVAGTILVEGKVPVLNEDTTVREYLYVDADADIMLEHVIFYEEELPFYYTEKIYTGREKNGFFLRWNKEELLLDRSTPYLVYDVVTKSYQPEIFQKLSIPLYAGSIQYREYYYLEKKYSPQQAEKKLTAQLEQFISSLQEKGVQIIEKDVKISSDEDSWIKSGNITVIERVETKQPTVTENIMTLENE